MEGLTASFTLKTLKTLKRGSAPKLCRAQLYSILFANGHRKGLRLPTVDGNT